MKIESFRPAIFLDTETTGIENCRLIELAIADVPPPGTFNPLIEVFRFRPAVSITPEASAVNGITDDMVKDLPLFCQDPLYSTLKWRIENSVVIAHNASFDIGVLEREGIFPKHFICTKEAAKRVYKTLSSHSLQYLREHLELKVDGDAHSAWGDVAVLRALYYRMCEDMA